MRYRVSCLVATLIAGTSLYAQSNTKILTGEKAGKRFVHAGKPLHPFCVDVPQEGSSRQVPIDLDKCSATAVAPKNKGKGWWTAEHPHGEGGVFVSFPPYVEYGVLANRGDRFLIATNSSGGGSGQFSNLFWTRLSEKQIVVVKDEKGGDRCSGGLFDYRTKGAAIFFSENTPAGAIVGLMGLKLAEGISDKLNWGYRDCDGKAIYRYDLKTEKYELSAVGINRQDVDPAASTNDPQACFNRLTQQYAKKQSVTLDPEKLRKFGREFSSKCAANR